jgi:hypothetical protein
LRDAFCPVSHGPDREKTGENGQFSNGPINFVMALALLNGKPSKASPRHAAPNVQSEMHGTGSQNRPQRMSASAGETGVGDSPAFLETGSFPL